MPTFRQADTNWISCAVCLNQKSKRVKADTIVSGYAVCSAHVELVSRPGFSIFQLQGDKKGSV